MTNTTTSRHGATIDFLSPFCTLNEPRLGVPLKQEGLHLKGDRIRGRDCVSSRPEISGLPLFLGQTRFGKSDHKVTLTHTDRLTILSPGFEMNLPLSVLESFLMTSRLTLSLSLSLSLLLSLSFSFSLSLAHTRVFTRTNSFT